MPRKLKPVIRFSTETLNNLRHQYKRARDEEARQILFVDADRKEHVLPLSYAKYLLRVVYDFNRDSW